MEKEEVFRVNIYFLNGEHKGLAAVATKVVNGLLLVKTSDGHTCYFGLENIAGFSEPFNEEIWGATRGS